MTPKNRRSQRWRETVRLFRQAADDIAAPSLGLFHAVSLLERMPEALDTDLPIVDFEPFNTVPDKIFSKATQEDTVALSRASRRSKSAFSAGSGSVGPALSARPEMTKSPSPGTRFKAAQTRSRFEPPAVFTVGRQGGDAGAAARQYRLPSTRPQIKAFEHRGGEISASKTRAPHPGDDSGLPLPPERRPASFGRLQHKHGPNPHLSSAVGILPTAGLVSIGENRDQDRRDLPNGAARHGSPADGGQPIEETRVREIGADAREVNVIDPLSTGTINAPRCTEAITKTMERIATLTDSLLAPSEESAEGDSSSDRIGFSALLMNAASVPSLTGVSENVRAIKKRPPGSLTPENRLAVWLIDSLVDALLSADEGVEKGMSVGESARTRSPSFSPLEKGGRGDIQNTFSPSADTDVSLPFDSFGGASPDATRDTPFHHKDRGIALAGALADTVLSSDRGTSLKSAKQSDRPDPDSGKVPQRGGGTRPGIQSETGVGSSRPMEASPTPKTAGGFASATLQNLEAMVASLQKQDDHEALAVLINDILMKQARRHGVDVL